MQTCNSHLPLQDLRSSSNLKAGEQTHEKLPTELEQICSQPPLLSRHSLLSSQWQPSLFRANPALQLQVYAPAVLVHICSQHASPVRHSFLSTNIQEKINEEKYCY